MAARKHATAAETAALQDVYAKLTDLLNALRDAQLQIHDSALSGLIDDQIERQLEVDRLLRDTILEYTGKPLEEGY
jgi:hypothetical protein